MTESWTPENEARFKELGEMNAADMQHEEQVEFDRLYERREQEPSTPDSLLNAEDFRGYDFLDLPNSLLAKSPFATVDAKGLVSDPILPSEVDGLQIGLVSSYPLTLLNQGEEVFRVTPEGRVLVKDVDVTDDDVAIALLFREYFSVVHNISIQPRKE